MSSVPKVSQKMINAVRSLASAMPAPTGASASARARRRRRRANQRAAQNGVGSIPAAMGVNGLVSRGRAFSNVGGDDACIVVRHREFLTELTATDVNGFEVKTFGINPGLYTTFPWLSAIANNYEGYRFRACRVVYEPSCGSQTAGTVVMCVDFDSADKAPADKMSALGYHGAVKSTVWAPCVLNLDRLDLVKATSQKYVRCGNLGANLDIKLYDTGNLFVCVGAPVVGTFGDIFIEYVVELHTPQLNLEACINANSSIAIAETVNDPTVAVGNIFGDVGAALTGGLPVQAKNNILTADKPGEYLIDLTYNGTNVGQAYPTVANSTDSEYQFPNTTGAKNAASTWGLSQYLWKVLKPGGSLTFSALPTADTLTAVKARIAPFPFAIA